MKKNIIFYACAAAALMFVSCSKQDETVGVDSKENKSELDVITATIMTTKTTTEDGKIVLWEDGDKIGLRPFSEENANASGMVEYVTTLEKSSPTATFVMVEDETDQVAMRNGKYIALYPSAPLYSMWSGKNESVKVGVPNQQTVPVDGGWDDLSAFMIATGGEDGNFIFHHVMSYIKLTVDAQSPEFDKVIIESNSSQYMINRIDISYDGSSSISDLKSYRSTSVTLTTTENTIFSPGTYYAALLPATYISGFTFSFYKGEELIGEKSINADVEFEKGDVANMGIVKPFTNDDIPEEPMPLEVATVYTENGKKQGIVYWVDPENPYKGKIVSVCSEPIYWAVSGITEPNSTDTNDGLANFNTVTGLTKYQEDANNFPAMKFCADMRQTLGGNWYLPVASEMKTLYDAYYGLSDHEWNNSTDYRFVEEALIDMAYKRKFDSALANLNDTYATLDGDADYDGISDNEGYGTANGVNYHLSKVNSGGKPQYLRIGNFTNTSGTMTTNRYVRCVRDVELQ